MLVSVQQLKKETNQPSETFDNKKKTSKEELDKELIPSPPKTPEIKVITAGNILGENENMAKRKEMISAKGFEPTEFAYERAVGRNDSLYSNFTELIALTKRKVGRIVIKEDGKTTGYATGFMVSPTLLLTNWHVFKNAAMTEESEVHFFYEYNAYGHPLTPAIFKFDTGSGKFFNAEALDYCFVAVQPVDVTGKISLDTVGYLFLDRGLGKIGDKGVEKLNIIHHPQGDYKQISIRENTFIDIDETRIFYYTDTAQGSSGSPVFNDQWQVVGLHHKSIAKMSPDGKNYLDIAGKVIPVVDDKIDVTKIVWLKNEGIRISVVLNHVLSGNPNNQLLDKIAIAPAQENLRYIINENENFSANINNPTMPADNKNISINVPVASLSTETSIEISLSSKNINAMPVAGTAKPIISDKESELLLEVAKVEKEADVDFSSCRGYNANFLGIDIPLPQPSKALENQVARMKNKKFELKYFKYSVIFNATTKMPIISAINVEGDAKKRLDNSKRKDDWLRDKRIDIECQLTDKFYAGSKFDKGHMSRFEDANWDDTETAALRNGIYTCFYTNACPQVVDLNRGGGLWGKLEKAILEKGIKEESGKLARMTVFNGPIFNEEKDRLFKGVTIPMEYFKVILWLNDAKKLRATAFKLSQETLVSHIKFDESMRIDEEAIDIEKDIVFKEYQLSIKSLGRLTRINFKHLEEYDTFKSSTGDEEMLVTNEESLML